EAFEKAGFKNAIQIKIQPDGADWDAGDIRYNVLRWTSSPNPPFAGYGPHFVNPRTGQIIGANIMLEYAFLTNQYKAEKLYEDASSLDQKGMSNGPPYCSLGLHLQHNNQFGKIAL